VLALVIVEWPITPHRARHRVVERRRE